jgi:hypothetical protein
MMHRGGASGAGIGPKWLAAPVVLGAAAAAVFFGSQAFGGSHMQGARVEVLEQPSHSLMVSVPVTEAATQAVATDVPAAATETATPEETAVATAVATEKPHAAPPPPPPAAAAAAAAVAPIETATPATPVATVATPAPVARKGQQYSEAEVRSFAAQAGWPAALIGQVVDVARCESGFNSGADGGGPLGLMQLVPAWFGAAGVDLTNWSDAVSNLRVARYVYDYEVARGYDGWAAWACSPSVPAATATSATASGVSGTATAVLTAAAAITPAQ